MFHVKQFRKGVIKMWTQKEKNFVAEMVLELRAEMIANGFSVRPIAEIKYSNAIHCFGRCKRMPYGDCVITIAHIAIDSGIDNLKNTIIHELCHAVLEVDNRGHNYVWKQIAKRASEVFSTHITVRVSEEEQKTQVKQALLRESQYTVKCNCCGIESHYLRAGKVVKTIARYNKAKNNNHGYRCRKCGSNNLVVI